MRNSLFALATVLALSVIGCGDDTTVTMTDMGKDGPATLDLTMTTTATDTCSDLITCGNACTTQACLTACIKKGTASAQSAYKALGDCIDKACPPIQAADGGPSSPCAFDSTGKFIDQAACSKCTSDSQMAGGACAAALMTCATDGM